MKNLYKPCQRKGIGQQWQDNPCNMIREKRVANESKLILDILVKQSDHWKNV